MTGNAGRRRGKRAGPFELVSFVRDMASGAAYSHKEHRGWHLLSSLSACANEKVLRGRMMPWMAGITVHLNRFCHSHHLMFDLFMTSQAIHLMVGHVIHMHEEHILVFFQTFRLSMAVKTLFLGNISFTLHHV